MNASTRRLHAAHRPGALFAAVGRGAGGVDARLRELWSDVLAILRDPRGYALDALRLAAVLRRVGQVTADALGRTFLGLYRRAHAAAARSLLGVMAHGRLHGHSEAGRLSGALGTRGLPEMLAAGPGGDRGGNPVPGVRLREDAASDLAALLLPAPAEDLIWRWLATFVRPEDYGLIGTDTDKRMPETVAHQLAGSMARGETPYQIAKGLRPLFDGSRVRAARAARTFGLHVGQQAQRDAWEASGMVIGYELVKTVVPDSRAWHIARQGRRYYLDPGPGQDGMSKCPHPPLEPADASERPPGTPAIAWNCLCSVLPILAE